MVKILGGPTVNYAPTDPNFSLLPNLNLYLSIISSGKKNYERIKINEKVRLVSKMNMILTNIALVHSNKDRFTFT